MDSKKQILIIEDDASLRALLERKLVDEGYSVKAVNDGSEGLAALENGELPDLILLDLMMPNVDGFGVLEKLSANGVSKKVPIVIISNSGQPVELDRAISLGVRDYLIKADFTPDDVMEKVIAQIGNETSAGSKEARKGGLLVVEDDKSFKNLLIHKLKLEGVENIDVAETGSEALDKIRDNKPDLVLLDLILPHVNGFSILETMRKDEGTRYIPVIILSNLGQEEEIKKCRDLGITDYFIKSNLSAKDVVSRIKEFRIG